MSPGGKRQRILRSLLIGICAGATVGASDPDATPATPTGEAILAAESPELVHRLYDRHAVILGELGHRDDDFFLAYVIFDQPRGRAMRLLTQTARQGEFRPDVKSIVGVHWDETGSLDEHRLRVLFVDVVFRLRYLMDWDRRQIHWRLDDDFDNDVKRIEGFWELYELQGDRTLGRFGSVVDVGPMLPGFLQGWITRKTLPRSIENCRRWVDSNGTYRP